MDTGAVIESKLTDRANLLVESKIEFIDWHSIKNVNID